MTLYIFLVLIGLAALTVGGDLLVRGSSKIAMILGVSPLIIGLTIVSFGTSAPELIVSIKASLQDKAALSLANVIGSNLFNTLLILGACALARPLFVDKQVIKFDLPTLIIVALLFLVFAQSGSIEKWQGLALIIYSFVYVGLIFVRARKNPDLAKDISGEVESTSGKEKTSLKKIILYSLYTLAGFALLIYGARWLIDGSVAIAQHFGVSDTLIGLTIIATGTSLPEFFASFVATLKGESEIAIGNVMGSNIYNISTVAGSAAVLSPTLLQVPNSLFFLDVSLLIICTLILYPMIFRKSKITRLDGMFLFCTYGFYVLYAIARESMRNLMPTLNSIFSSLLVPLLFIYAAYIILGFVTKMMNSRFSSSS